MPAWRDDLRALPAATPGRPLRVRSGDLDATLDHAELGPVLETGYEDAAAAGAGREGTWRAGGRLPPPVAVDHVPADARAGVRGFSGHSISGTDLRAVPAVLVLVLPRA